MVMLIPGDVETMSSMSDQADKNHNPHSVSSLQQCATNAHAEISKIWPTDKDNIAPLEDVECCKLASDYTESWSPHCVKGHEDKRINLLILAESHATTNSALVGQRYDKEITASLIRDGIRHHGIGHLNVVHCLSYGEAWMLPKGILDDLDKTIVEGVKSGTPQFWRALAALSGYLDFERDCDDPLEDAEDLEPKEFTKIFAEIEGRSEEARLSRIRTKLRIKHRLQERGILLADVSPVPIYAGGGTVERINQDTGKTYTDKSNKLNDSLKKQIVKTAFEEYAQHLIEHYRPRYVLVFGVSVERAITQETLQKSANDNQGFYLGCLHHPSYNCLRGRNFINQLRYLRRLAAVVQEPLESSKQQELAANTQTFRLEEEERIRERKKQKQSEDQSSRSKKKSKPATKQKNRKSARGSRKQRPPTDTCQLNPDGKLTVYCGKQRNKAFLSELCKHRALYIASSKEGRTTIVEQFLAQFTFVDRKTNEAVSEKFAKSKIRKSLGDYRLLQTQTSLSAKPRMPQKRARSTVSEDEVQQEQKRMSCSTKMHDTSPAGTQSLPNRDWVDETSSLPPRRSTRQQPDGTRSTQLLEKDKEMAAVSSETDSQSAESSPMKESRSPDWETVNEIQQQRREQRKYTRRSAASRPCLSQTTKK